MKRSLIFLFFICGGIVFGSLVAELSKDISWLSWLSFGSSFGLSSPLVLDLSVLSLTLGLTFKLTVSSVIFIAIGIVSAYGISRRNRRK